MVERTPVELTREAWQSVLGVTDKLMDELIDQQRAKVLRLGREAVSHLSPEDVLNPHDYPELKAHPTFEFEDGILAGMISSQAALRAELKSRCTPPTP